MIGLLGSSALGYTKISCNTSGGNNSAIPFASIDFPTPGSPIRRTFLLCFAAFLIVSTDSSCPITWSIKSGGTFMSPVLPIFS